MKPERLLAIIVFAILVLVLLLYLGAEDEEFLEPDNTGPPEVSREWYDEPDNTG